MSLSARIKATRLQRGMSQEAVARAANISVSTYRMIEWDQSKSPQIQTLIQIAQALEIPLCDLIEGAGHEA